jgi:hypothetical protein
MRTAWLEKFGDIGDMRVVCISIFDPDVGAGVVS